MIGLSFPLKEVALLMVFWIIICTYHHVRTHTVALPAFEVYAMLPWQVSSFWASTFGHMLIFL